MTKLTEKWTAETAVNVCQRSNIAAFAPRRRRVKDIIWDTLCKNMFLQILLKVSHRSFTENTERQGQL